MSRPSRSRNDRFSDRRRSAHRGLVVEFLEGRDLPSGFGGLHVPPTASHQSGVVTPQPAILFPVFTKER